MTNNDKSNDKGSLKTNYIVNDDKEYTLMYSLYIKIINKECTIHLLLISV